MRERLQRRRSNRDAQNRGEAPSPSLRSTSPRTRGEVKKRGNVMMCLRARAVRLLALLLPILAAGGPGYALDYPTRPVRFIVSFAAGCPNDTIARILGQYLSEQLGQAVVVEDHVGAGGNIGMQDVLTSAPDGYTIGFVAPNNAINHTLYQNIPFDFVRDSTPIAGTMSLANVMEENLAFPAKNLAEFLA